MDAYDDDCDRPDDAPGLTVLALDGLVRDAWRQGYGAGQAAAAVEAREARIQANAQASVARGQMSDLQANVDDTINRVLSHVVLGLRRDRAHTTIAAERQWMESQAQQLERGIARLRGER